jgi:pyruvate kinase
MRRTKIIATLGPRSNDADTIGELIEAGVDVFRLNFAHSTPEEHAEVAERVRAEAKRAERIVGLLADLPGPKMRTGPVSGNEAFVRAGNQMVLTSDDVEGTSARISTSIDNLVELVSSGDEIFLADGAIVLRVQDIRGNDVVTEVVRGGVLRSRKGMHIPGAESRIRASSATDEYAVKIALELEVDFLGVSFVCDAEDIARIRSLLPRRGRPRPEVVAKIETRLAVENLAEVVIAADAVMVARGDLGIQTPLTRVPLLQKEIIGTCNRAGKLVITATQMLESMVRSPLPTRAEVADVANAVVDGTDALMLSEETAIGADPPLAVRTMAETALTAETWPADRAVPDLKWLNDGDRVSWAVAHAGVQAAEDLNAAVIVCPTRSGSTPRRVAAFRPSMPVVALSQRPAFVGAMALVWGVHPLVAPPAPQPKEAGEDVDRAVAAVVEAGLARSDDLVIVVAGSPGPRAGRTDYVRVARA